MIDVLVVEDNRELGKLLCDFLKAEGYRTALAPTGEEGLALARTEGARLVVLDVMLPGMDGLAVCRALRREGDLPILVVSARSEKEDKLAGLRLGADDYIEKPYDVDILLAKIRGISGGTRAPPCATAPSPWIASAAPPPWRESPWPSPPRSLTSSGCWWNTAANPCARSGFSTASGGQTA